MESKVDRLQTEQPDPTPKPFEAEVPGLTLQLPELYRPIADQPSPKSPRLVRRARNPQPQPKDEGWLDLAGGQLELGGRKFFIVDGRVTRFNENTGEVLGQMSILSSVRPSLLNGHVTLRVGRFEFMLNMLQSEPSNLPGEHRMRFSAVLVRA